MPRLSFVVPVYNPDRTVFDAHVRSIIEQSFEDWEAIYVLDGEQPTAKSVLDSYLKSKEKRFRAAGEKIRYISIPHGGAPTARNAGKSLISGSSEFVSFFDCDSQIEPGASEAWIRMFDRHKDALFVYAGYKFSKDEGAVPTLPWSPDMLRVRNYISGHFPVRRAYCPDWAPELKSLQDWDFWLSVLDRAEKDGLDTHKIGKMMLGYAFKTEAPKAGSISGEGCKDEVWLERMDAVKKRHNIPERETCVASIGNMDEGLRLARFIGADFWPYPGDKPNRYKTMIQVGYSLKQDKQEAHATIFQKAADARKVIFWTAQDIDEMWTTVNLSTLKAYEKLFSSSDFEHYCEDKKAKDMLADAGIKAEILPIPLSDGPRLHAFPEKPRILVEYGDEYRDLMVALNVALPDYQVDVVKPDVKRDIRDYTALVHFYRDRSMSNSVKRAHLTGRHVISNIQQPFCGYVNDKDNSEVALKDIVHKIRSLATAQVNEKAANYYAKALSPEAVRSKFAPKEVAA